MNRPQTRDIAARQRVGDQNSDDAARLVPTLGSVRDSGLVPDQTPDVDVLDRDINLVVTLLRRYGESFWANWPEADARRIAAGDAYGLTHLLQSFGGMGSFTDLRILSVNGYPVDDHYAPAVNDEVDRLRSSIYENAKALLRDAGL